MKRNKLGCLVAVLVVVGFFLWLSVNEQHTKQREQETSQRRTAEEQATATASAQHTETALKTLVARHNAIIPDKKRDNYYLLDYQEHLMRSDQRPVVFTSYLQDIMQDDDGYRLSFSDFFPRDQPASPVAGIFSTVFYWLRCDKETFEGIKKRLDYEKRRDHFGRFPVAIAAVITAVDRPWVLMKPLRSHEIFAQGRLIDVLPLERQ